MTASKCPRCQATTFEVVDATIAGAKYQNKFVRCTTCHSVVGVLTAKDAGVLATDAVVLLKDVQAKLDRVLALLPPS